jgi:pimeloyl-ACP methyl ester carboxylesterase
MEPMVNGCRSDYPATVRAFVDACIPEPDSDHIRRWARQILLRAEPEAAARVFESHYEENAAADITQIAVPTLVIHGEDDVIVPFALGRAVADAIPGAEFVALPDTGHVPTMTRAETVVAEVERWAAALPAR